jgi:hypothetical protein
VAGIPVAYGYDGGLSSKEDVVSKQGQVPPTAARGSPAADVPRSVAFARRLFVLAGVLGTAYIWLALMELDRVAVRELTVFTIGLAVVATATMLPFAVLVRGARPWARKGMIITCVMLIPLAVVLTTADAAVMHTGWFAVLHYATSALILAAAIGGAVGLIGADAGAYFRRHQPVAEDDARLWPISRMRDLQTARAGGVRIRIDVVRPLQSALPLELVAVPSADRAAPAPEAFARAA